MALGLKIKESFYQEEVLTSMLSFDIFLFLLGNFELILRGNISNFGQDGP
jgi:hypothetical protein